MKLPVDEETLEIFRRSARLRSNEEIQRQKQEQDNVLVSMGKSVTSLENAFNMIKAYSENILNINKADDTSKKRTRKENTVESYFHEADPNEHNGHIGEAAHAIQRVVRNFKNSSSPTSSSFLGIFSNIKNWLIGAGVLVSGAVVYEGLKNMSEGSSLQGGPLQPVPTTRIINKTKAPNYTKVAEDEVKPKASPHIGGMYAGLTIAEKIGEWVGLVKPPGTNQQAAPTTDDYEGSGERYLGEGLNKNILQYFISHKYPLPVAQGITAGIMAESQGDPRNVNKSSGAYGIGQWLGPRKRALFRKYGTHPSLNQQLDFLDWELHGGDPGGKKVLRQKTAKDALHSYIVDFMRPAAGKETTGDLHRGLAALGSTISNIAGDLENVVSRTIGNVSDRDLNVPKDLSKYITANSDVHIKGVHPTVMKRFAAMAMDYNKQTGDKIHINSAFRTQAEQAALFSRYGAGRAATPGHSRHQSGLALDISSVQANRLSKMGLLSKYHFIRPVRGEPWHIEPEESRRTARSSNVEENFGSDQRVNAAVKQATLEAGRNKAAPMSLQHAINQKTRAQRQKAVVVKSRAASHPLPNISTQRKKTVKTSSNVAEQYRAYLSR